MNHFNGFFLAFCAFYRLAYSRHPKDPEHNYSGIVYTCTYTGIYTLLLCYMAIFCYHASCCSFFLFRRFLWLAFPFVPVLIYGFSSKMSESAKFLSCCPVLGQKISSFGVLDVASIILPPVKKKRILSLFLYVLTGIYFYQGSSLLCLRTLPLFI